MIESNNNFVSIISTNNNLQGQINSENNLRGQMSSPNNLRGTILGSGSNSGGGGGGGDMYKAVYDTNNNGIVDNAEKVNNHTVESDVPSNAVFTDTTYAAGEGIDITNGVISNTQTSAEWGNITGILTEQTDLKNALDEKADTTDIPDVSAFITKDVNNLTNYTKSSDLSNVAISGNYSDLNGTPTIPTVNNSTITIQKNGTTVDSFTTNTSSPKTIDISVPTKTSDLNNDSGFINNSVNNLTNYTSTSSLTILLAGKEKYIPQQTTAPSNPSENDLWIDTSNNSLKRYNGTEWENVGSAGSNSDNTPVGKVTAYAGTTAPRGYLLCDGSAISRTEYAELFSTIGTTYGSGDGSTTFNIPNIKGRNVVGLDSNDSDFDTLGETGGEKTHTLTIGEMPNHEHAALRDGKYDSGNFTLAGGYMMVVGYPNYPSAARTGAAGGGQAHNNMPPHIVLNYIIKASATTTTQGQIIDSLSGDSTTDAPSVHAVNTLKPVELYSNSSGATGTITLSDNYTNYSKLEITTSLGTYIYNCNIGPTDLIINSAIFNDTMYIDYMRITFTNDNKVNVTNSGSYYQNANHTTTNNKIYKVVGYK